MSRRKTPLLNEATLSTPTNQKYVTQKNDVWFSTNRRLLLRPKNMVELTKAILEVGQCLPADIKFIVKDLLP